MSGLSGFIQASFAIDRTKLDADLKRFEEAWLGVAKSSVTKATRETERELEAAIRAVTKGNLWRAVTSRVFPEDRLAYEPTGSIRLNSRHTVNGRLSRTYGAVEALSEGRRGGGAKLLAIPLPAANPGRLRGTFTPQEWEQRTGRKLRYIPARGRRPAMLVADKSRLVGKKQVARFVGVRNAKNGLGDTIPVFLLIPDNARAGKVPIGRIVENGGEKLRGTFERGFGAIK